MLKFTVMEDPKKQKTWVSERGITYTVSEELSKLNGKIDAPRKLAEANELLRKMKTPLPDRNTKK